MTTTPNIARAALLSGLLLAAATASGLSERSEDIGQFLDRKARSDAQAEQSGNYTREETLLLQQEAQERVEQFHRLPRHLLAAVSKGELSRAEAIRRAQEQPNARETQPQTAPAKAAKARYIRLALVAALVIVLAIFRKMESDK
ncbi:MAG: hypothetical protein J6Z49_06395 [Kiritimatiellae bacterium]|nr:hypothetical protein [Kiritimatiellia bacterium]